jgi:hypothetical protein
VVVVLREGAAVQKLEICGTEELPAALSALESAEYVDAEEDAARWVARAFTGRPSCCVPVPETTNWRCVER